MLNFANSTLYLWGVTDPGSQVLEPDPDVNNPNNFTSVTVWYPSYQHLFQEQWAPTPSGGFVVWPAGTLRVRFNLKQDIPYAGMQVWVLLSRVNEAGSVQLLGKDDTLIQQDFGSSFSLVTRDFAYPETIGARTDSLYLDVYGSNIGATHITLSLGTGSNNKSSISLPFIFKIF
jgi:hypothetical protein